MNIKELKEPLERPLTTYRGKEYFFLPPFLLNTHFPERGKSEPLRIIAEYLAPSMTEERFEGLLASPRVEKFVDLSDPTALKAQGISKELLPYAKSVLKSSYEVLPRCIATNEYGRTYAIDPEILAWLMNYSRGKR